MTTEEKKEALLKEYNAYMDRNNCPNWKKDALPVEDGKFCVDEMDNYLCDANFSWHKDKGINKVVSLVELFYQIEDDLLEVRALIDDEEFCIGYKKTSLEEVIRLFTSVEEETYESTNLMIDYVDRFLGLEA